MKQQIYRQIIYSLILAFCTQAAVAGPRGGPTFQDESSDASYYGSHVRATHDYRAYVAAHPKLSLEERKQKYLEVFAEPNKLYQKDIRAMRKELLGAFIQGAARPQKSKLDDKKNLPGLAGKNSGNKLASASEKRVIVSSKTGNRSTAAVTTRTRASAIPVNAGGADAVSFKSMSPAGSQLSFTADDDDEVSVTGKGTAAAASASANSAGGADAVKFQE